MAAMEPSQPRKKLATYGKSARRRIFGYDSGDCIGRTPESKKSVTFADDGQAARVERAVRSPTKKHVPETGVSSSSDELTRPTGALQPSPLHKGKFHVRRHLTTPTNGVSRFRQPTLQPPPKQADVFDVPSSDDELSAKKPSPKRPLTLPTATAVPIALSARNGIRPAHSEPRPIPPSEPKRISPSRKRKADACMADRTAPPMLNDSILQRHIEMQCAIESKSAGTAQPDHLEAPFRQFQTVKRDRISQKGMVRPGILKSPPARQGIDVSRPKQKPTVPKLSPKPMTGGTNISSGVRTLPRAGKPSRTKTVLPQTVKDLQRPKEVEPARKVARRTPPRAVNGTHERRPLTSQQATPPRVAFAKPPHQVARKSPSGANSPRQTDLWSQLLEAALQPTGGDEADVITMANGSIHRGASHSGGQRTSPRKATQKVDREQTHQQPRRRLIDSLATQSSNLSQGTLLDDEEDAKSAGGETGTSRSASLERTDDQPDSAIATESQATIVATGSQAGSSQVRAVLEQGGPKITYARERSYLTESVMDEATMFSQPLDTGLDSGSQGRRMGAPSRPVMPKDPFDMDDDDNTIAGGALKSIHELRQAGGNKRFQDETEALLEDIESRGKSSISRRRNALLELGTKLVDKAFARRFVDQSLDRRVLMSLDREKDILSSTGLVAIIALLSTHGGPSASIQHARDQGAMSLSTDLLEERRSIATIAKTNMSRVAQKAATDFGRALQQSPIWVSDKPHEMTPNIIALRALETVTRQSRESGNADSMLCSSAANVLVRFLESEAEEGGSQAAATDNKTLEAQLALSILESCTLNGSATDSLRDELNLSGVTDYFLAMSRSPQGDSKDSQTLIVRLLLNVTNNSPKACDDCGSQSVIHALVSMVAAGFETLSGYLDDEARLFAVDYLILALAALINFAEWSDGARAHVLRANDEGQVPLETLLRLFVHGLGGAAEADSMEKTHSNVAFGYLAVLLGNLCLSRSVKQLVCAQLPGATLRPLSDAVGEFLQYHKKVDDQFQSADGEATAQDGFTARLQTMANRLHEI